MILQRGIAEIGRESIWTVEENHSRNFHSIPDWEHIEDQVGHLPVPGDSLSLSLILSLSFSPSLSPPIFPYLRSIFPLNAAPSVVRGTTDSHGLPKVQAR